MAVALQYQVRVVDVLQDEAHDDNVELVLRSEVLEVGFDDPPLEIGRVLPELLDHHAGPVDDDVVVGCLGKNPGCVPVAQPQLQQRSGVAEPVDDSLRIPVQNQVVLNFRRGVRPILGRDCIQVVFHVS
ncbi:hypothetical protein D3C71_1607640 [compost metagenome]